MRCMCPEFITKKELAKRWHCSEDAITKMEQAGKLKAVGNGKVKPPSRSTLYRLADVILIEGGSDASPMSPWERKRLETEIADRDKIIAELRDKLQDIFRNSSMALTSIVDGGWK